MVGDVCIPRKRGGRHYLVPLHSDIQVRARKLGLDCLQPIFWHKIANGVTEAEGNGAGFYGKPYQPGGIIKNDIEYILFLRKGGEYRPARMLQKALSMLTKEEMKSGNGRFGQTFVARPPATGIPRLIRLNSRNASSGCFRSRATPSWTRSRVPVQPHRLLSCRQKLDSQ